MKIIITLSPQMDFSSKKNHFLGGQINKDAVLFYKDVIINDYDHEIFL